MTGNVWEWCQDLYDTSYYSNSPSMNPTGPTEGFDRVYRGGSWYNDAWSSRVSYPYCSMPDERNEFIGFRLAL